MKLYSTDNQIHFGYACRYAPLKNFNRHMHSEYEILLFLEESGSYMIEGREYELLPYTLLLIPSNTYHFAKPEKAAVYCRYILSFRGAVADGQLLKQVFGGSSCCRLKKDDPIVLAFHRLYSFGNAKLIGYEDLMLKTLCNEILLGIYAHQQLGSDPAVADRPAVDPIIAYVEEHFAEIQSVEALAELFYMSTSTLTHRFKKRMGISLMKYIRQKRLYWAKSLLEQGNKPLDVCARCGFNEYTTFYKAYVSYFGKAPSKEI